MARRVTWTNNSTDYDGTNVYRDTTIDPQNLPEPIATVGSVAQGATVEYIDLTGSGGQCCAVRDFDSSGDGALSDSACIEEAPDYDSAEIGDEIGGGVYAGTITYPDAREFHIIASKDSGWSAGQWKTSSTSTSGTSDDYDGLANTQSMISASPTDHPAASFCDAYEADGYSDWHMPSFQEVDLIRDNLRDDPIISNHDPDNLNTFSSTEASASDAKTVWFGSATSSNPRPKTDSRAVMAIRRVPV